MKTLVFFDYLAWYFSEPHHASDWCPVRHCILRVQSCDGNAHMQATRKTLEPATEEYILHGAHSGHTACTDYTGFHHYWKVIYIFNK